ncbi:MAG: chorismate mutase [Mycobacterium sp.]
MIAAAAAVLIAVGNVATAAADGDTSAEPLYELMDAATQRLQTADAVAASKWITGGPITDPARAGQVLSAVSEDAESLHVPSEYVTTLFTDQINATEAIQYNRFSWWKLDPAAAPVAAPDLSASRAQIDVLNHRMVAEIAEELPVLRSPDCPVRLDAAKAAVARDRSLDPLYRQALDAATRSYCG